MERDPLYLKGIKLFNAGRYFEAHEAWEDLWHTVDGAPKDFLQGLIQAAVALHHFRGGNLKGARTLYPDFQKRLAACGDAFWGLDLKRLLADLRACFKGLEGHSREALPGRVGDRDLDAPVRFEKSLAPKIDMRIK